MRRYSKDPAVDKSLRHSVRDGVAYSVMSGAGDTYFSAFALHLKATTAQVGLLASLPPLVGSAAQLLSAWIGRRRGNRRRIILTGVALQAALWLPILLLPWLFPEQAVPLFIASVVLYHGAANLVAPQWSSLMGDLVPERRRGRYFALRNRLASITAFTALVSAGIVLHFFAEAGLAYFGFLAIFITAASARLVSLWHLAQMHDPTGKVAVLDPAPDLAWWRRLRHSPFVRFSLFHALMQGSVAIASPFFTVYMLRDLEFSYVQFMVNTAASVLMQFLTLGLWGRISDVLGNRWILVLTGMTIPLLPALWLVSTDVWYLLCVQAFGGLMWAGFSLSAGNFAYDLVPAHNRVTHLAYHNVLSNLGIFGGALLGAWLGSVMPKELSVGGMAFALGSPLLGVFLVSSLARLVVAALFLRRIREVRRVRKLRFNTLIFRVARFHALAGLGFDVVARRRAARRAGKATPHSS